MYVLYVLGSHKTPLYITNVLFRNETAVLGCVVLHHIGTRCHNVDQVAGNVNRDSTDFFTTVTASDPDEILPSSYLQSS